MSRVLTDDYNHLINKLNNHEPFAFGHFNDGEMQYILNSSKETISRGDQDHSKELEEHLRRVFISNNKKFYRGIPCRLCFPKMRIGAIELLTEHVFEKIPVVDACVFHHNYYSNRGQLFEAIKSYKKITWITSEKFNLNRVLDLLQIDREKYHIRHLQMSNTNSYNNYKEYCNIEYETDELVILLCGPIGRILAGEGIDKYPKTTFLCLGSYFDNMSNDARHGYYYSDELCAGCCPINSSNDKLK